MTRLASPMCTKSTCPAANPRLTSGQRVRPERQVLTEGVLWFSSGFDCGSDLLQNLSPLFVRVLELTLNGLVRDGLRVGVDSPFEYELTENRRDDGRVERELVRHW